MINIESPVRIADAQIELPGSKSISNRVLILNALSGGFSEVKNLSDADDTVILKKLLTDNSETEDCGDGGTTSRFLIALRCLQGRNSTITGSDSLINRPVAPLLQALEQLGAEFEFTGQKNCLPLRIVKGVNKGGFVEIPGNISSQFISALMMIAPYLEGGLVISIQHDLVSGSYIQTTAGLMSLFGVTPVINGNTIIVPFGQYSSINYSVGADWSSAGYWYSIAALLPGSTMFISDLIADGLQPDERVLQLMKAFGVESVQQDNGIRINSVPVSTHHNFQFDFTDCPDLAQTIAVMAAVKGITVKLTGLKTLRGKETDRIAALKNELERAGVKLVADDHSVEILSSVSKEKIQSELFKTYNDHRMAMSLSLLSCSGVSVKIDHADVVNKSFPGFWNEMRKASFKCS